MECSRLDEAWLQIDWSRHVKDVMLRGRRIRYVDVGTGPALVLVHGQGGSWEFWLRSLPSLAQSCRVVAVDLAGFGESERVIDGDVFDEHVATIRDLLSRLELDNVVVVGHSMGGLVSIRFSCEHPDVVAGLALVDAGGFRIGPTQLAIIVAGFRIFHAVFRIRPLATFVASKERLRMMFFAFGMGERGVVSRDLGLRILPRMASPGFIQTVEAAAAAASEATPDQVRCPTLVVWGSNDRLVPLKAGCTLQSQIPDARLVILDGVGHCPMIEAPVEFSKILTEFAHDPQGGRARSARDVS